MGGAPGGETPRAARVVGRGAGAASSPYLGREINTTAPLGTRERYVALAARILDKRPLRREKAAKNAVRAAGLRVTTQAKTTEDSELLGSESKPRTKPVATVSQLCAK